MPVEERALAGGEGVDVEAHAYNAVGKCPLGAHVDGG